jgi:hypothetical protein
VAAGRGNRAIAAGPWVSERAVERHPTNLYGKIEARHRAEAVAVAPRRGPAAPAPDPGPGDAASPASGEIAVRSR